MSVLFNWISEFKRFCPALSVRRYHSTDTSEKAARKKEIMRGALHGEVDVVVTTYEMLVSEKGSGIGSMRWRYLVLDEAHKVKNNEALVSSACRRVIRESSLFLTGTPIQNNLKEAWCLLNCLQPDIFAKSDLFDSDGFDASDLTRINFDLVNSVSRLLGMLVLRRKKTDVNIDLPPKQEIRLLVPLSSFQSFWYKRLLIMNAHLLANGVVKESEFLEGGTSQKVTADSEGPSSSAKKMKLANLMMQLRKMSNHPFLFNQIEDMKEENTLTDYRESSGKLAMLERLLIRLKANGHRAVIFSQFTSMLNIIEDFLTMLGFVFVRIDGSTNRVQRMINISQFNHPKSQIFVFLLSTRAGGLGVNLQTADTCILFDSDWNPQADVQAMGRVHRIGQKKPVTVYRLVSAGTVEERIVARAARKLLLDDMVSRENTFKMIASAAGAGAGAVNPRTSNASNTSLTSFATLNSEEDAGEEPNTDTQLDESTMRKVLLFSMRRLFKANGGIIGRGALDDDDDTATSPESLDRIITNTLRAAPHPGSMALSENGGKGIDPGDSEEEEDDDFAPGVGAGDEEAADGDKCFSLAGGDINTREFRGEDFSAASIFQGKSLWDIRQAWEARQALQAGKRDQAAAQRTVTVEGGVGVGRVAVLKSNMYSLESGEPPLVKQGASQKQDNKRLMAGRDYFNFDFCQSCGTFGGELVLCDGCPATYHVQCLGFKNTKEFDKHQAEKFSSGSRSSKFYCPHHSCAGKLLLLLSSS